MTTLPTSAASDFRETLLSVLFDSTIKGIILLLAFWGVALLLRRSSAAVRHFTWTLALAGLLILPLLSVVLPKWQLPLLPRPEPSLVRQSPGVRPLPATPITGLDGTAGREPSVAPLRSAATQALEIDKLVAGASPTDWRLWFLMVYVLLGIAVAAPLGMGLIIIRRLALGARPFRAHQQAVPVSALCEAVGLRRPVEVRYADPGTMPMATGLFHPVVLLPAEAEAWPEEKLRAVLLHEFAHVRRRDCLIHALARLAVALHWFNPLAWMALRRLRIEREQACDDLVLAAGERPSSYAGHLVEVARTLLPPPSGSGAAVAMASRSPLDGRIRAILDATRNRKNLRWGMLAAGVLLVLAVAGTLSALKVGEARIFSQMTPQEKAEFEAWYTQKVTIPAEDLKAVPLDPSLLQAIDRFYAQWPQHEKVVTEIEESARDAKVDYKQHPLPEAFAAAVRERLPALEPLMASFREVTTHPRFTVSSWRGLAVRGGFFPGSEITKRWRPVQGCARVLCLQALSSARTGDFDTAVRAAEALVAGGRVERYETLLDRMLAVALLEHGLSACDALEPSPLEPQHRQALVTCLALYRAGITGAAPAGVNALTLDQIGLTLQARRSGIQPDFQNKTGYEIMRETIQTEKKYVETVLMPGAAPADKKQWAEVLSSLRKMEELIVPGKGGARGLLSRWTEPMQAAVVFSVALPGLARAEADRVALLSRYDQLQQRLAAGLPPVGGGAPPAGQP